MKKNILLSLSFAFLAFSADAQEVKRYLTFEHFTNTVCSICASKNPGFFTKIDPHLADLHHMTIHPPVPYTSCVLYQHNANENATRASYYNISGTPKVFLDGTATGSQMITDQQLTDALGKTSPIGIAVTESTGSTRDVTVDVRSFGDVPSGNYKLYVAVVEKTINYDAPNGESVHHNVFRRYLAAGESVTPAANGAGLNFTYNYSMDSEWVENEIYVLAYLQNDDTKEILNSGTRFDEALPTSNKNLKAESLAISIAPNPASNVLYIDIQDNITKDATLQILDVNGKVVWTTSSVENNQMVDVSNYAKGIYFLNFKSDARSTVKKVLIK